MCVYIYTHIYVYMFMLEPPPALKPIFNYFQVAIRGLIASMTRVQVSPREAALSPTSQVASFEIRQRSPWDDGAPMQHLGREHRAISIGRPMLEPEVRRFSGISEDKNSIHAFARQLGVQPCSHHAEGGQCRQDSAVVPVLEAFQREFRRLGACLHPHSGAGARLLRGLPL